MLLSSTGDQSVGYRLPLLDVEVVKEYLEDLAGSFIDED